MKKVITKCVGTLGLILLLTACGKNQPVADKVPSQQVMVSGASVSETTEEKCVGEIDIDLTILSSTVVFSEVYNMMVTPENYIGKKIKMAGAFSVYEDQETGQMYYACVISDATACCAQGIEFVLDKEYSYPGDYPETGSNITVTGTFETYEENGYMYCRLVDAEMDKFIE